MHPETNTHGGTTCSRLSYDLTVGGGSSVLVYHTPSGGPRHRVTMSSCLSTHLLRSLETEWDGRAREKGSHGARVRRRAFTDGTVTSKVWPIKKGTPNRGDRQVLAWMLDAGTIQRQELSDLLRNIKGKLARATSWLSGQGGWPSWKGIEAVGEAILAANKNTASTVGP